MSRSSVDSETALNILTGMLTNPKAMAPDHIAFGIVENAVLTGKQFLGQKVPLFRFV
jgi:hypothetical protein